MSVAEQIRSYLSQFTVGIAGCGGLGSNCAVALARSGVGRLIIADFDVVTAQSLDRQYFFKNQIGMLKIHALEENIQRINPEIIVKAFNIKLCVSDIIELYSGCDIIVEAFDTPEMKHMIIETVRTKIPDKILTTGNVGAGWGNSAHITTRHADNLVICGDGVPETSIALPVLGPRVGMIAHMQANEVLDFLLKDFKPEI